MLGMIWAQGHGRAIGRGGTMAWHVPKDMAFFRRTTMGRPVIMGRKTWESLGAKYQPLDGRENIVVTRNPAFGAPGARVVGTVAEARDVAEALVAEKLARADGGASGNAAGEQAGAIGISGGMSWVMGGAQIYEAALGLADILAITEIDVAVDGADAFAPAFGAAEWDLIEADPGPKSWNTDATSGLAYRFTVFARRGIDLPAGFTLLN